MNHNSIQIQSNSFQWHQTIISTVSIVFKIAILATPIDTIGFKGTILAAPIHSNATDVPTTIDPIIFKEIIPFQ